MQTGDRWGGQEMLGIYLQGYRKFSLLFLVDVRATLQGEEH
jgi:hypothetical protein